jgi:hypothetical protein
MMNRFVSKCTEILMPSAWEKSIVEPGRKPSGLKGEKHKEKAFFCVLLKDVNKMIRSVERGYVVMDNDRDI